MSRVENKNRFLLITLLVLIAATLVYYWYAQRGTTYVDKTMFQVERLDEVDQVILQQQSGEVVLKFDGTRWLVNDEPADRNLIDVLFATLQQAQPVRPLARTLQDSIQQELQANGVRVRVLSGGEELSSFLVGGNARKSEAYFQQDNEAVYLMNIPGYRVYVSGIFELDKNGWKDKHAFQINWRNFQGLSTSFSKMPAENFNVNFNNGFFRVEELTVTDTTRLNDYLDAVSFLVVDSYATNDKMRDSLNASQPALSITLRDVANRTFVLSLYPDPGDTGRVAGVIDSTYLAWFDRRLLDGILKTRSHFAQTK